MNEAVENVKEWVEILENSIYDEKCPSDFEKTFCDGNELLEVWFSSERIQVVYLISSGATVINSFTIDEFSDWLEKEDV